MSVSLIAAIDEQGGLGVNNELLCHLPADLLYFKTITTGKPIIMGRKTYESIGRPLPNRINVVISKSCPKIDGVIVYDSIDKVLTHFKDSPEIMIIGGANLFEQTIAIANKLYITKIHHIFKADVFFPQIDATKWDLKKNEFRASDEKNAFNLTFQIFERK